MDISTRVTLASLLLALFTRPVLATQGFYFSFGSWWIIFIIVFIVIALLSCIGACIRYKRMREASTQHAQNTTLNAMQYTRGAAPGGNNMTPYGPTVQFVGQPQQPPSYISQSVDFKDPNAPPSYNDVVGAGTNTSYPPNEQLPTWEALRDTSSAEPQPSADDATAALANHTTPYPLANQTAPFSPANESTGSGPPPTDEASYPNQPVPYSTQSAPYPTQPSPYPTQTAPCTTQLAPYPTQPAPYPTQPAPYPTQ